MNKARYWFAVILGFLAGSALAIFFAYCIYYLVEIV